MTILTPYLSFEGNCADAMTFYKECLGGDLKISKVGESPMKEQMPDKLDWVMHAELRANGIVLMASDLMMDTKLNRGNDITLTLNGGTPDEVKMFFEKLSAGGNITHQFEETFFGFYGDLTDKYGIHWAFQADKLQA